MDDAIDGAGLRRQRDTAVSRTKPNHLCSKFGPLSPSKGRYVCMALAQDTAPPTTHYSIASWTPPLLSDQWSPSRRHFVWRGSGISSGARSEPTCQNLPDFFTSAPADARDCAAGREGAGGACHSERAGRQLSAAHGLSGAGRGLGGWSGARFRPSEREFAVGSLVRTRGWCVGRWVGRWRAG